MNRAMSMRLALVFVSLSVLAVELASASAPLLRKAEFAEYKLSFGKSYLSDAEEQLRLEYFSENLARIERLNEINGDPVFGLTHHTDRKPGTQPFKRGRKGKGIGNNRPYTIRPVRPVRSSSVDWRGTQALTPVKNQGQCGSCWAFSATEQIESQLALAGLPPLELSPQQISSCVTGSECCDGCGGGDTVAAYEYLMQEDTVGLATSEFWPYAQSLIPAGGCEGASCTQSCSSHDLSELDNPKLEFYLGPYASISGYSYATKPCDGPCDHQDLDSLASALHESPVSICLNAQNWDDYTGGVMTADACGGMASDDLDHCVQLVGYNNEAEKPYWIVRNSWSAGWGENGFIYLQFDENTCGLADEATVVHIEKKSKPAVLPLSLNPLTMKA